MNSSIMTFATEWKILKKWNKEYANMQKYLLPFYGE